MRASNASPGDIEAIFTINADALPGVAELTPQYFEHLRNTCALFRLIPNDRAESTCRGDKIFWQLS
jgi:hypothetical protein